MPARTGTVSLHDLAVLILGSVALWFLIDSTGSLAAGAPLNILGNLVFLAMFLWPLRRPIHLAPA